MATPTLIIAGITLPIRARLDYQQTYEPLGGTSRRRLATGAAFSATRWRKWKTTIIGGGWIPAALLGVDYDNAYTIHCVQPIALLPGEVLPVGWAARHDFPEVTVTDEAGVATRLVYPILTVRSDPPQIVTGADPTWTLTAEED